MNILIIGNGFDLAHGLPTRYTDFLSIAKLLVAENSDSDGNCELTAKLRQGLDEYDLFDEFKNLLNDNAWFDFLSKRFERGRLIGANWIDFEAENRQVVFHFENAKRQDNGEFVLTFNTAFQDENDFTDLLKAVADKIRVQSNNSEYLSEVNPAGTLFSYQEYILFSEYLYKKLRDLTRAFEIYCVCLVNKLNEEFYKNNAMIELDRQIRKQESVITSCKNELSANQRKYDADKPRLDELWKKVLTFEKSGYHNVYNGNVKNNSPRPEWAKLSSELSSLEGDRNITYDRLQIYLKELNELKTQYVEWRVFREVQIDNVLSFNYTNTFSSRYGTPDTKYCYLHGVAQLDPNNTNMVFGIDETLPSKDADRNFTFLKFKKYYQRIFYNTDAGYRDWLKGLKDLKDPANVYIIGHSLGTTDHEILREFLNLTDKTTNGKPLVKVSLFYYDEESKINAIERIIEIIGKNKLTDKVHGSDWTIRFVNQNDPKDGLILI